MSNRSICHALVIALFAWLCLPAFAAAPSAVDPRQTWQLLDYVAVDYDAAVQAGIQPSGDRVMKQIKAFVHRNRALDLIHALEDAGFRRLSLFDVKGLLRALSAREQEYSVEFGDQVLSEVQMELFCEETDVARAVEIFRSVGRTGKPDAGWIYVSPIEQSIPINDAS